LSALSGSLVWERIAPERRPRLESMTVDREGQIARIVYEWVPRGNYGSPVPFAYEAVSWAVV